MKKIFLTVASAALVIGFTACSSEDTTTTTTDMDTSMNTVSPVITAPTDNTGNGIEGDGMNTDDRDRTNNTGSSMNNSGGSSSATNAGSNSAQGGSNSSGIMGPGTNVTNTGSSNSGSTDRNTTNTNKNNDPERFQAGPDVKTPAVSNSQRGGNDVIEKANETNDRSDRVKTPKDVNPRTGLAPVR